jgi:hypothetical protein
MDIHPVVIDGENWYRFDCEYRYDDSRWSFSIMALDWADAEARVAQIRRTVKVDGQVVATIHCTSASLRTRGTIVQVAINLINGLHRLGRLLNGKRDG